jgi:hypothetical protein
MANSSLVLSSLDFDTLKGNFKEYLKSQSVFKDYNFDGSNISVLLDVMAYNSYLNSFYLNMVASEMFLDSAQKYNSVISHAKELNYTPRSSHASVANVSFTVSTTGIGANKITIPKGTKFSGVNSNGTYNFVTDQTTTYVSSNNYYVIDNLQINQGIYFQDSFIVDYNIEDQRFILTNDGIDTSSITVTISDSSGANSVSYSKADSLFGLTSTSTVFFLQAVDGGRYQIVFGDGLFGRKPDNLSSITVSYIVTEGTDGNGVDNFSITDNLGVINGGSATVSDINVITASTIGANQESIESIRFAAPRKYASQQRAVTSDDYASLVVSEFGGQIDDVIIYGGQELEPKEYGRVVVCIKPSSSTIAPDYLKNQIKTYLNDYIVLPNRVKISDPEYFYIKVNTVVQYNSKLTTKYANEIQSSVLDEILAFSKAHIEKFGNDFRYSKFVTHIDETDTSITSNDTNIKIVKKISPKLNFQTSYDIRFNNKPEQEGVYNGIAYPDERVFTSTAFDYVDSSDVIWSNCYLEDDAIGNIILYTYINGVKYVVNSAIGTIDYVTGRVIITNLKTSSYINSIALELSTQNKDIISTKNMILLIEAEDVSIEVIETVVN